MVDPTYRYNVHFVFDRDCGGRGGEIEFGGSVMTDGKNRYRFLSTQRRLNGNSYVTRTKRPNREKKNKKKVLQVPNEGNADNKKDTHLQRVSVSCPNGPRFLAVVQGSKCGETSATKNPLTLSAFVFLISSKE